jgi:hypothetical protein
MKRIICLVLTVANLLLFSAMLPAASPAARPMTDEEIAAASGGSALGDFLSGVGCGLGFTLLVSGYASGVGAPAALLLTAATLKSCSAAFGF